MKLFTLPIVFQIDWLNGGKTEKPSVISETVASQIDRLKSELEAKKENKEEAARIRNEILGLKRELNRTKQFTTIAGNKNIEKKNDLDSISASNLMRVDKEVSKEKRGEFLSKSFLYKRSTDSEGIISEEPTDGRNLKEGDILFVDFGKNKSANMRIGLWQMLWADIGYVKVNGQIGVRSIINNRVGYYTKSSADGYIPVFTGDTVSIPTVDEIRSFEEKKDAKLVRNSDQKASDEANDNYIEQMSRIPEHRGIDLNLNTRESFEFWKGKGFSKEQACGIVANEFRESSSNPKNTNGIAVGIFQWEWDRKTRIEKQFWKQILDMSHSEQLEVAYWEMTSTDEKKIIEPLKNAKTSREAAEIFSKIYERPRDTAGEMNVRGDLAEIFENLIEWRWVSPIAIMGTNREEIENNLVVVNFLWQNVKVHKCITDALKTAEQEIISHNLSYTVKRVDGYNWRNMRGKDNLSYHALGIAIDINPEDNMGDFWNGQSDIPNEFVNLMKKNGFIWWGDWKSPRRDPMHFEYSKPELLTRAFTQIKQV